MDHVVKKSTFALLSCAAAFPVVAAAQPNEKSPNILFILVDDFRYDALGYCGNPIVHTPAIDDLAQRGVFFNNAFASTPISSASRASILTGLQERTHRYSFQTGPLEDSFLEQSYPIALRSAGYRTALFGKLGVLCTDDQALFDEIENYDRDDSCPDRRGYYYKTLGQDTVHLTRYTGQKGLDFIEEQSGDKPFFLSLCFSAPHAHDGAKEQYFWDKEQDHLFEGVTIPDPEMSSDEDFKRLPEFLQNSFSRLRWTWRFDTPEKYQEMMKGYYRMIAGVDAEIEKVVAKLEEKGLADNTVIIFLGDNGYFLGERQLADKWLMYDLSVRVPMIIYDPRGEEHKEVDTQVLNIDVASTIADYAAAQQLPQWQGKSLRPLVEELEAEWDRDAILIEHLWEMPNIPPSEGVRTDKWKYFRYINDERIEELYDLERDPSEANNLADKSRYQDVLVEMRAKTEELKAQKAAVSPDAPFDIMVDRDSSPLEAKAQSSVPTFAWKLAQRSASQKAYQILVACSEESIDKNIGDVWNSGVALGSSSTSVLYGGDKLQEGATYYWKVRVWDYLNRTTEYSEKQQFSYVDQVKSQKIEPICRVKSFSITDDAIAKVWRAATQSSLAATLPLKVWGVEAQSADYSAVTISPDLNSVTSSEIEVSTLFGDLSCEYTRVTRLIKEYKITVPANMRAEFLLPDGLVGSVILNKKVEKITRKSLPLLPGENTLKIQVNTF